MRELASVHPADMARRWRHIFEDLKETNKQQDQLIRGQPGVSVENIDSNMGGTERGREGGGRDREKQRKRRQKIALIPLPRPCQGMVPLENRCMVSAGVQGSHQGPTRSLVC